MGQNRQSVRTRGQSGSALLIAIFALLLISVVGIALLVSTGSDSALAGNYRTSTAAYYAAVAGLEEARGRLLWKNPDFLNKINSYPTLFTAQGTPSFGMNDVLYIVNPAGGETVNPLDPSSPYADKEYGSEFTWQLSGATVHTPPANSVSQIAGIPGPLYKWVRINAVTAAALNVDVSSSGAPPPYDSTTPLYFDGTGLNLNRTGIEALEITTLAYMPDRSTKVLQYVVAPNTVQYLLAPTSLSQGLPAPLTLAGNGVSYAGPDSTSFYIDGNDPSGPGRTCSTPPLPPVFAIGFTNPSDQSNVVPGDPGPPPHLHPTYYFGYIPPPPAPPTPSTGLVSLPLTLQKPSQLDALVQTITQNADIVIHGSAGGANLTPLGMSPTNYMTVVVNGDLDLNAWHNTGYGLLLVTGSLNYDPDASWEGVVLVIGKGTITGSRMGIGRFDGAVLVAQTRDAMGNLLPDPNLGASSVKFTPGMGGNGIYYNSCTMLQALAPTSYRILSFREITQ
jgi:hypothetical protein